MQPLFILSANTKLILTLVDLASVLTIVRKTSVFDRFIFGFRSRYHEP
jgi:hypothetical protein